MTTNIEGNRAATRYSEAFKMSVVRELETSGLAFSAMAGKYGIKGADTVQTWVRKYGNGSRGKVIRVEKPEEIDQTQKLKERVRVLERTVGSLHVELALERAYTNIACERAGIEDVAAFKKKRLGSRAPSCRSGGRADRADGQCGLPAVGDEPAELLCAAAGAAGAGGGGRFDH